MKKGFTIIEMIIVLVIFSILLCIVYPHMKGYVDTTKMVTLRADFNTIHDAIYCAIIEYENKTNESLPLPKQNFYDDRKNKKSDYSIFLTTYTGFYNNPNNEFHKKMKDFFHTLEEFYPINAKLYLHTHNYSNIINKLNCLIPFHFSMKEKEFLMALPSNYFSSTNDDSLNINNSNNNTYITLPSGFEIKLKYVSTDTDDSTYVVGFVYNNETLNVAHIIIANKGYISIDGGELIKIIE